MESGMLWMIPGFDGQESECRECMDAHERPLRGIQATIPESVLYRNFSAMDNLLKTY